MIQNSHYFYNLEISFAPFLISSYLSVFEPGSIDHILTEKVHHQYIWFNQKAYRTRNDSFHPFQITKLFLSPHADHLARVAGTISSSKSKLSLNISVSIFEHKDGSFIDLNSVLLFCYIIYSMVDIGFFTCRDAAVDLMNNLIVYKFYKYPSGSFIKNLLNSRSVSFIFGLLLFDKFSLLAAANLVVDFVEIDLCVQLGELIFMIKFSFSLGHLLSLLNGLPNVILLFLSLDLSFVVLLVIIWIVAIWIAEVCFD